MNATSSQISADAIFLFISFIIILIFTLVIVSNLYILIVWTFRVRHLKKISKKDITKEEEAIYQFIDKESRIKYYNYLREEIKREDEITHQRLTWSITFQGFLINALAIMLVFTWENIPIEVFFLRKIALFALGIIGIIFGLSSFTGVIASKNSVDDVKRQWEDRNLVWGIQPNLVPQAFGQGRAFSVGALYAVFVPVMFVFMWSLYLMGYTLLTLSLWVAPCADAISKGAVSSLNCLYKTQQSSNAGVAINEILGLIFSFLP